MEIYMRVCVCQFDRNWIAFFDLADFGPAIFNNSSESEREREIEWMGLGTRAFFNYFLYYHARNAELFHGT